jgi:hypothetical protein
VIVVTSFSQRLYGEYAYKVLESFENWPEEAQLVVYSEDMGPEYNYGRVEFRDLNFPELLQFKERCPPNPHPGNYRWEAAKFANKVWALTEGLMTESGLCFWLDADCVTYRKLSADFLRRLIPPQYYVGYFDRPRAYPETGFMAFRANHECHKPFMEGFKRRYTSGKVFRLPEWHDAYVFGHYVKKTGVKAINLSGDEHQYHSHPMSQVQLAKYIDHMKGPRKEWGHSPENHFNGALRCMAAHGASGKGQDHQV